MLRPDQIADLSILMCNPRHLHLSEPGTGKTPTICVYQRWLWNEHGTPSVWVMPRSLLEKNRDEALKWGGWEADEVVIADGGPLPENGRVYLMGFRRFTLEWEKFPRTWRAIQIDEFHKGFGGAESAQTQALFGFMERQGEFFTPMTGTLIDGKMETVFPAVHIIEPRYYGNFKSFCHFHRMIDVFTGNLVGYQNHDHLQKILQKHSIRRLFSDIFGHQQIVTQVEWVSMAPAQRAAYDKFDKEALLELEQFYIDGTQPGVAFIRARQIMEHPNKFPNLIGEGYVDILNGV